MTSLGNRIKAVLAYSSTTEMWLWLQKNMQCIQQGTLSSLCW